MKELIGYLAEEQNDLDGIVSTLNDEQWDLVTPAEPWTIRDTISHLAFFDERQTEAIRDPDAFTAEINTRLAASNEDYMSIGIDHGRALGGPGVLEWWREARIRELDAFGGLDADFQLPWYGPPMKAASAVTARLMETWAHGQDIVDVLGVVRAVTERLFPIAELGVKTFSWSFVNRGLPIPDRRVRVTLTSANGDSMTWNPHAVEDSIRGNVEEFCLVVAQRRHLADTSLVIDGEVARRWMEIAQIFAGPPGPGRSPLTGRSPLS